MSADHHDLVSRAARISAIQPPAPVSIAATGIPFDFLAQLACKVLLNGGQQSLSGLAARMRLPGLLVEEVLAFLRQEQWCDVAGPGPGGQRLFCITERGRLRAVEFLRANEYCGPVPVSLAAYCAQCEQQSVSRHAVGRADFERGFDGVLLSDDIRERLGPAINSGRPIFMHGPAGAGKSFLAARLGEVLGGEVLVPHAVLVQGQVMQVLDPNVHQALQPEDQTQGHALSSPATAWPADHRWVRCRRPAQVCGGELTLDMLDLRFDQSSRFYIAPPQVKANGGVLIIDDLGRQRVSARELMNRWIVPMDRGHDYLSLHTGEKFRVPFDLVLVFCTNLAPQDLADDAFLRRLGYKIGLGPLDRQQFRALCRQACKALGMAADEAIVELILSRAQAEGRPLLACTPRDLLGQLRDRARYLGMPVEASPALIDWAWGNYYIPSNAVPSLTEPMTRPITGQRSQR